MSGKGSRLATSAPQLPNVPKEGQPPDWWQDMRVQALAIAVITSFVKKVGIKVGVDFDSNIASTVAWAFQIVIPAVLGFFGQLRSIWRRRVQAGAIVVAEASQPGETPDITADKAAQIGKQLAKDQ
jgi:hypothetical protein